MKDTKYIRKLIENGTIEFKYKEFRTFLEKRDISPNYAAVHAFDEGELIEDYCTFSLRDDNFDLNQLIYSLHNCIDNENKFKNHSDLYIIISSCFDSSRYKKMLDYFKNKYILIKKIKDF